MNAKQWLQTGLAVAAWAAVAAGAGAATLEECVRTGLTASPSLEAMRHRLAAAEALQGQARSARWPQVSTSASYTGTDNAPQAFFMTLNQRAFTPSMDFTEPGDVDQLRFEAGVKHRLWDGQRGPAIAMADAGRAAADGHHQRAALERADLREVGRSEGGIVRLARPGPAIR